MFHFFINNFSRLPHPEELSHKRLSNNYKYQDPDIYTRLFGESGEGPFEVPPGHVNVGVIIKPLSGASKL